MSEKITLSGVPETMLQTVYARAKETKTRGAITDNKAVEIIDRLDYDFSMADKDAAMHSGVIARTIVLDKLVKTYLAGHGGLYPNKTGVENLLYLAQLKGVIGKREVEEAIQRVGLDPADKRVFGKYSMGMKQRLVIAQAIMEKPDVIMLDEPTNGLDEAGIKEIRQLIEQEKERGALILLASHNQEDMKILADQVYKIADGRIERKGTEL